MASVLKVDKLDPQSGTALELGTSGDTITVPSGVGLTLTNSTLLLPTTITSTTEVKTNKISPATGVAFALGDSGDTFTIPSGATITNSGTATGFGGGKLGQVLQAVEPGGSTQTILSAVTWVALTDMTQAITTSSGSTVLIMLDTNCYFDDNIGYSIRITFNHSGISETDVYVDDATTTAVFYNGVTRVNVNHTLVVKHSPSTTNEITYTAYARNSGESYFNNTRQSSLTLMEILS